MPLKHYSNGLQFRLVREIKLWNLKITSFNFREQTGKRLRIRVIRYLNNFVLNNSWGTRNVLLTTLSYTVFRLQEDTPLVVQQATARNWSLIDTHQSQNKLKETLQRVTPKSCPLDISSPFPPSSINTQRVAHTSSRHFLQKQITSPLFLEVLSLVYKKEQLPSSWQLREAI